MIKKEKKHILRVVLWVILFILMSVIFYFSTQTGGKSQNTSDSLLYKLIKVLPDFLVNRIYLVLDEVVLSKIIRKTAHFILFLLLGSTSYGLCLSYFPEKLKSSALTSWLFSSIYAVSDEIHQSFVPGRSGQFSDIFLDSIGAACGILSLFLIIYCYRKIKISKN